MSERVVHDCDRCGEEIDEPEPLYASHAGKSHRVDLCHKCAITVVAKLLHAHEQKDYWNGTRFINEFGSAKQKQTI